MSTQPSFRDQVLRVVAVVGLIAVLLLGAWGIIQIAFNLPSFFGNITNFGGIFTREPAKETLTVSVPTAVLSERAFPLTWKHSGKSGEYSYSISYACVEGVSVVAPLPNGSGEAVACNTPFNYLNATSSTPMMVKLTDKDTVPVTFTIAATKLSSGIITATATSTTSVNPLSKSGTATTTKSSTTTKKPTSTTTKKPTTTKTSTGSTYTPSGRTQNLYGYPDLQVYITSNPGSVQSGTRLNLQFVIENIGTNVTPSNWSFTASLPYSPTYTYQSEGQQALYPGDKIVYNLGYDAVSPYQYQQYPYDYSYYGHDYNGYAPQSASASVSVDPYGYIAETNKYNNTASVSYTVY
jgi:hypothetical protein